MRPGRILHRGCLAACASAGGLALGLAGIEWDSPLLTAVRVALGFFTVGFAPGIVLVLAGGWGWRLNGLAVAGLAAALSLAIAQLLCGAALALHVGSATLTVSLMIATTVGAVALMAGWRQPTRPLVFWPSRERWLLGLMIAAAVALYPKGSPVYAISIEDFWHLAPISRLAGSPSPTLTATFVEPGLAFTHPASGMHFFMAMVANASGEQPIFVFNKMRSFAGLLAPLFLYLTARRIFVCPQTAALAGLGVLVLVMTGSLADTGWHWGQGAPVSHNTDLVMGMVVPGVVWMMLSTLPAAHGARYRRWLVATGLLFSVVVCSHIREGPQLLLYAGMFAVTSLRYPSHGRRAVALAGLFAVMIFGYQQWHHRHVPQIVEYVVRHRDVLEQAMHHMRGVDWWRAPAAVYPLHTLWVGWHAVFIIALPLALARWGRRPEALGVILSLIAALLLIRLPALSLAANWATYDEILMFPVRFFTPFTLLLPGALLAGLMAIPRRRWLQGMLAIGAVAALTWSQHHAEAVIARQPDLFFGLALFTAIVGLVQVLRTRAALVSPSPSRGPLVAAAALAFTGLLTGNLAASPFGWLSRAGQSPSLTLFHQGSAVWTWRDLLANLRDSPPAGLVAWIRREVPADEVILSNPAVSFPLTAFTPNPGYGWSWVFQLGLSTPMQKAHKESYTRNGGPLFFNLGETAEERLALCERLGARVVVLDPTLAASIKPLLDAEPTVYTLDYEESGWYLYRVHPVQDR